MAYGATTQQILDPRYAHSYNVIKQQYGHTVSVPVKGKNLTKFGRLPAADTTPRTVWSYGGTLAHETYATTNVIDSVSSSSASDTGQVTIEGHTVSGGNITFVSQTATLNGQTKVTLGTPLVRANRIYNSGTADFVGSVYVYESDTLTGGVPDTSSKVHLTAPIGYQSNTSLKCSTSISSVDYWLLEHITVAVLKKTAGYADFQLQVRPYGTGPFRTLDIYSASNTSGTVSVEYDNHLIIPPNSDVRVICTADAVNTDVMASVSGALAIIV